MSGRTRTGSAVVSGTKTGGHLHPAVSVGRRLQHMGMEVTLVASGEASEETILRDAGIPIKVLKVGRLKGAGAIARLRGLAGIPVGLIRSARLLRSLKPNLVVGFGGYTTGPLLLAAALLRIPTAICEENSIPGLTNRILARFVSRIFVAYEETARRFDSRKVVRTGTPVRPEILAVDPGIPAEGMKRVLVFGGSQGSAFLNENIPPVLARLVRKLGSMKILHQTGMGRSAEVEKTYRDLELAADVTEYVHAMGDAYGRADFVICRSGAGTVAEIAAVGLPALFIPFAAAADNHQVANAAPLVEAGGALMVEEDGFDGESVAKALGDAMADGEQLKRMAEASRSCGKRDSLELMVGELMTMVAA